MSGGRPRAAVVEDCLSIDIDQLARAGAFDPEIAQGQVVWRYGLTGDRLAAVNYSVNLNAASQFVLTLELKAADGVIVSRQRLPIGTTYPFFGGVRHWFHCGVALSTDPCNARVRVLYLPPEEKIFGCRACYDLTYSSCRASHRYDGMFSEFARLRPGMTAAGMKSFLEGLRQ